LPELYRENHFHYTSLTNDLDKPGFPNEYLDMLKHIEVDYWFEEDLDEQPDIFVSDFVNPFAERSFKLEDFTLRVADHDPEIVAIIEMPLHEDGGTAREMKLVSQRTERLNIVFYKDTIAPYNAFVKLREAIALRDEW
jgi:hypothetical protein